MIQTFPSVCVKHSRNRSTIHLTLLVLVGSFLRPLCSCFESCSKMLVMIQRNLLVIAILISSSVRLASATYLWAPIQHEERVPRITDLGEDSKSTNGTLQDMWMKSKSLKAMLRAQVVKYLDVEGMIQVR